jgi:hypothetical protein
LASDARHGRAPVSRSWTLLLAGLASALGYASFALTVGGWPLPNPFPAIQADYRLAYCLLYLLLYGLWLGATWLVLQAAREDALTLGAIIGFAVLFRLLLLPTPPVLSGDIHRYVWDARVLAAGLNPYLTSPDEVASAEGRKDALYQNQNRPSARTIYPPLAQAAFLVVRKAAGESVTAMKGLMVLGDLVTLLLLVKLLEALGLARSRCILYAWHPLAVFEFAGSGHVDALALPWILLAVLAWHRRRFAMAGLAVGAATLVKIYPILLLPALLGRRRWPVILGGLAIIFLGYLPFLPEAGIRVLGHLPRFLSDPYEVFNPSLMGLVLVLAPGAGAAPVLTASWIGRLALVITLAWVARGREETSQDLLGRVFVVGGAATLLTLTLHPWYLLWLMPFLAIQPRAAWIYLSGAVVLSYALYVITPPARAVIVLLEYAPFLLLLWRHWRRSRVEDRTPVPTGFARGIP